MLVALAAMFAHWREALVLVKPETLLRWHRQGFKLFWSWRSKKKSNPRPRLAKDVVDLICMMATAKQAAERAGAALGCERTVNHGCYPSGDATDGLHAEHQSSSMQELTNRFKVVTRAALRQAAAPGALFCRRRIRG